jgi:hypothetical protein
MEEKTINQLKELKVNDAINIDTVPTISYSHLPRSVSDISLSNLFTYKTTAIEKVKRVHLSVDNKYVPDYVKINDFLLF